MTAKQDAPEDNKPAYIDTAVRSVQAAIEEHFLFRKLGLPFDYASDGDDFPSKFFATSREARNNQPNPLGLGSGYYYSCRNHALLFDSYLLRLELGIEGAGDEAILDRLIGGLIRLATIAPKSFLVGGLAADGRGFYGQPRKENHAAWIFAVNRGLDTSAIAMESQEKFRSIAGKMLDRVRRDRFRLTGIDGKPAPDGDISQPTGDGGAIMLAMLLTAARLTGDDRDWEAYTTAAEENGRARLAAFTPEGGWDDRMPELMWRQCCLSILAAHDREPARVELVRDRMRDNARIALGAFSDWRKWEAPPADQAFALDWRKFPKAEADKSPYGFVPPESWDRVHKERHLESSLCAGYVAFMPGDKALVQEDAATLEECLRTIPWNQCATLNALAGVIGVHGRGLEMGLWDEGMYEEMHVPPASETSYAAKYMKPEYDTENPDKSGHRGSPSHKSGKGGGSGGGTNGAGSEQQGNKGQGDGTRKRRKRRKARA